MHQSILFNSCSREQLTAQVGNLTEPLNQSFGELLVKPQLLKISFVSQIPKGGKGYWEEQGYEWFGGI